MPEPVTILITDDELQSRSLIRKMLQNTGRACTILESGTVADAIEKIRSYHPHLLFLDVQMKGETGFDLLDKIDNIGFEIIFTTAHSEYALKAFRYSAMDYLVKPIDPYEFSDSFNRACERIHAKNPLPGQQVRFFRQLRENDKIPDKLIIASAEGFHFININDILYCHAVNNYTEFHLSGNQKIISSHTLGYYDEWMTQQQFFRVHRSYIVNLSHIKMYKRGDGGTVVMHDGREIEVSRNNKEAFLKLFKG